MKIYSRTTPVLIGLLAISAAYLAIGPSMGWASHKNQNRSHLTEGGSGYFYITNAKTNSLTVVDISTMEITKRLRVGERPLGVSVTPDEHYAMISNFDSNSVSVVDLSKWKVIKNISVGTGPDGIAISPDGRRAYVANSDSDDISVIDVHRLVVEATCSRTSGSGDVKRCAKKGTAPASTTAFVSSVEAMLVSAHAASNWIFGLSLS